MNCLSENFYECLEKPFLSTLAGATFIFIGSIISLLASLFEIRDYDARFRGHWVTLWGVFIVTFGCYTYAFSSFINQPILISIGAFFLAIGLSLFFASQAWQIYDDYDNLITHIPSSRFANNYRNRAGLAIAASVTVLIGCSFFAIKGFQRFVKPYFGPVNYNLYGCLTFGAGTFSYMMLNINHQRDIDVSSFILYLTSPTY